MRILLLNIIAGCVILASCNTANYDAEVKMIDHMMERLDSTKIVFNAIDTTGYESFDKSYKAKTSYVQQAINAKGDTVGRDLALFLGHYRDLKKPYSQFKMKYDQTAKEIQFAEKQLITLKHDLEGNLLDTNLVGKMMSSEIEATNEIVKNVNKLEITNLNTRKRTKELEPKMDSIIDVLKAK